MPASTSGLILLAVVTAAAQGQVVYQTGFEEPTFANGNLLSQDGWEATDDPATSGRAVVQSALAAGGLRSVRVDASVTIFTDWFWKDLGYAVPAEASPGIQVSWDMYLASGSAKSFGWGIDVYDDSLPVQRRVTAVIVNNQDRVLVWDETNFVDTGLVVTRDAWHNFKLNMNYAPGARTVIVTVDNVLAAADLGFSADTSDTIADVDLYNIDGGGADQAYYDNFSVAGVTDADGDGLPDIDDLCPSTAFGEPIDVDGCSIIDDDGDGVFNDHDLCPATPACATTVDAGGCPADLDDDLVPDGCDNCPSVANGPGEDDQADDDGDGIGNVCDACPTRKPADVSGDGFSDGGDVQRLVEVLLGDPPTAEELCAADLDLDLSVTLADVPTVVEALLGL